MNALTHGMNLAEVLLGTEDPLEYERLRVRVFEAEEPVNGTERMLCDKVVDAEWLRMRFMRGSASALRYIEVGIRRQRAYRRMRRAEPNELKDQLEKLLRERLDEVDPPIADPAGHVKALQEFSRADEVIDDDSTLLGEVMLKGGLEVYERLTRYFAQVDRAWQRALNVLRREQKARGKEVAVAPSVDVDCTIHAPDGESDLE